MQRCLFVRGLKIFNRGFEKLHIIPINKITLNLKSPNLLNTSKHKLLSSPFVLTLVPFFNFKKPFCLSNDKLLVPVPSFCLCAPKVDERNEIYSINFKFQNWFYSLGNFLKLFLRCGFILLLFFPFLLFYPLKVFSSYCDNLWWLLILRVIEFSGPVLVKLGQWASTRRDLFPEKMCCNLSKLQHDRHPHAWRHTAQILSKYFGDNWRENFTNDFSGEPKPVGSGCVAQVYKMYANSDKVSSLNDGRNERVLVPVALKVLHPRIEEQFLRDITILRFFAKTAEFIFPSLKWLSLQDCVSEFSDFMLSQIDLQHEGQMLEKFANNFKKHAMVKFPQPIHPFVTKEVLLETWEEGIPIAKFVEEKVDPKIKEDMAILLINILLKMAFVDNLVHSDLHPGNIFVQMVRDDGEKKTKLIEDLCDMTVISLKDYEQIKYKLVILDCGLTTELSSHDFDNFFTVFKSVILNRGDIVAQTFLNNSMNECPKPDAFSKDMEVLVNKFREKSLSLAQVDVGGLLGSVFNLLMYHKVKLESRFSSIMVGIMVLEGLGRSLDPTRDILEEAIPYLLG